MLKPWTRVSILALTGVLAWTLSPTTAPADDSTLQVAQVAEGSLVLYSKKGYLGSSTGFDGEVANLDNMSWNNQAESLTIRPGDAWEVCADTGFKNCKLVERDIANLKDLGLEKKISSIRPIRQVDPNYIESVDGRTVAFFAMPRENDESVPACPGGGTGKKCMQKQANRFCRDSGLGDAIYYAAEDGILDDVLCER